MFNSYCAKKESVIRLLLKTGIFLFFILQYLQLYAISPGPDAAFEGSPLSGYGPLTVNFMDQSSSFFGVSTTWSWDFGDGGTSSEENPQYVYGGVEYPTSYTVTLIVSDPFGTSTAVKVNYITVTGTTPGGNGTGLGFTADPTSGIAPFTVSFQDTTGGNPTSWLWNFGDGFTSNMQNPQHQYETVSAPTSYTVTLIESNAFGTSTVSYANYIHVTESGPGGGFYAVPTSGNTPLTVQFYDTTSNNPNSWNWSFGDGGTSTSENPSHLYGTVSHPTSYIVRLIVSNAYGTSTSYGSSGAGANTPVITVLPPVPGAGFYAVPTSGNTPLLVQFYDTTSNNPNSWNWSFGDGGTSTSENPSHLYGTVSQPTSYVVRLIVSNGYGTSTSYGSSGAGAGTAFISVLPPVPGAGFYAVPTSGNTPLTVQFYDTTSNNPNSWNWSFGDGGTSTSENPSHLYGTVSQPTSYVVRLIVSNAYGTSTSYGSSNANSTTPIITVLPPALPGAGFYAVPTSGNTPLLVQFYDTTSNNPNSWNWSFGDGGTSTSENPSHLYGTVSHPTSYVVRLIVSNAYGTSTSYGSSNANSTTPIITVLPPVPGAGFYAVPTSGQTPLLVQFYDTTSNNPNSWNWSFGDGGTSTSENPSHLYGTVSQPTSYVVRLIVSNAYGTSTSYGSSNASSTSPIITVLPPIPVAGFYASPTSGTGPLTVNFTDTSAYNPTSWSWDFGDGGTSTSENPVHAYSSVTGNISYTVRLIVSNLYGTSTATQAGLIRVLVSPPPFETQLPSLKLFPGQSLPLAFDINDFITPGSANSYSVITNFLGLTSLSHSTVNELSYSSSTVGLNAYGTSNGLSTNTVTNLVKYSTYKIQELPKIGLTPGSSYVIDVANYTLSDGASLPPPSFGNPSSITVSDFTRVTAYWSGDTAVVVTSLSPFFGEVDVDVIAAPVAAPPYGVDIDKERIAVFTNLLSNGTFSTSNDTAAYALEVAPGRPNLATQSWMSSYTDLAGTQADGVWRFTFNDASDGVKVTPFSYNWLSVYTTQGAWYIARMHVVSDTPSNTHQTFLYSYSNLVNAGVGTNIGANVLFGTPTVWTWMESPFLLHVASTSAYPQFQLKAGGAGSIYVDELQFIKAAPTLIDANRASTRYKYIHGEFNQASDTADWGQEVYLGSSGAPVFSVSSGYLRVNFAGATTGNQLGFKWTASTTGNGEGLVTPEATPGRQIGVRLTLTKETGSFNSLLLVVLTAIGVQSSGQYDFAIPPSNLVAEAGVGALAEGEYRTVGTALNGYYQFQFGLRSDEPGILDVSNVDFDRDVNDPTY